jgi:metal-responsive CopG/Arc/MetJ family transcriptional regulator
MRTMALPSRLRDPVPVCVTLPADQMRWLDAHATTQRISRSALVRQAIDALIHTTQRQGGARG